MKQPICKCGKPCKWYGLHGGYSKRCIQCNEAAAKKQREGRARRKAERNA